MRKLFFLISIFLTLSQASILDKLLEEYSQKSDLSQKTKLENSGHLFVYTRNDIINMQAKNLKDILKSIPDFTYEESRYGYSDIYNSEGNSFSSHTMRLYLDNQELISGNYGSGLPIYGDMSLDFIDHIEVYLGSPSYKFTTESSLLVVKLYTKTTNKDLGGKYKVYIANDGYKQTSLNYLDLIGETKYQIYFDYKDDKQDKLSNKNTNLSRDKKVPFFFTKFEKDDLKLNFHALSQKADAYVNLSKDATPLDSSIKTDTYNINLEKSFLNNHGRFSIDHSLINTVLDFKDDNPIISTYKNFYQDTQENVTTIKTTLEDSLGNHNIFSGFDIRRKDINFKTIKKDNLYFNEEFDLQTIYSIYLEDEYWINNNSIFTFSTKYSKADNNGSVKDDNAHNFRLGHIYTLDSFTFKTYYSNTDMLNEPYLFTSTYANKDLRKMTVKLLSHETSYKTENSKTSLKLGVSKLIDAITYSSDYGVVVNIPNRMDFNYVVLSNEYQVLNFKNFFSFFYSYRDEIPGIGKYDYRGGQLRTMYKYGAANLFSELIYRQNDESKKDFYDLSIGCRYKIKKDFTLMIKGENILNKGYSTKYNILVDPTNPNSKTSLYSNNSAKRYLIGIEYLF